MRQRSQTITFDLTPREAEFLWAMVSEGFNAGLDDWTEAEAEIAMKVRRMVATFTANVANH
jgi:hypothetical protein